ncbi:hypothetical protein [Streptomyces sp. NPDC020362]|uniref:hypothetical protein n=1 Tax=unclassified Streptomyces TaxID=2593676 RepID=UPI0034039359
MTVFVRPLASGHHERSCSMSARKLGLSLRRQTDQDAAVPPPFEEGAMEATPKSESHLLLFVW